MNKYKRRKLPKYFNGGTYPIDPSLYPDAQMSNAFQGAGTDFGIPQDPNQMSSAGLQSPDVFGKAASGGGVAGGMPWGAAGNIAGNLIDNKPGERPEVGRGVAANAAKGAGMGAQFGPWGAAIGGVAGGIYGGITAKKQQTEFDKGEIRDFTASNKNRQMSKSMFRRGGRLPQYNEGGDFHQIPNGEELSHEQGGVNIGDMAELENDETMNPEEGRVFSDKVNPKRPYAKLHAKIQKKFSKRPNDKFSKEAKQIEEDKLFEEQETYKESMLAKSLNKAFMKYGGKLPKYPTGGGYRDGLNRKEFSQQFYYNQGTEYSDLPGRQQRKQFRQAWRDYSNPYNSPQQEEVPREPGDFNSQPYTDAAVAILPQISPAIYMGRTHGRVMRDIKGIRPDRVNAPKLSREPIADLERAHEGAMTNIRRSGYNSGQALAGHGIGAGRTGEAIARKTAEIDNRQAGLDFQADTINVQSDYQGQIARRMATQEANKAWHQALSEATGYGARALRVPEERRNDQTYLDAIGKMYGSPDVEEYLDAYKRRRTR